MLLYWGVEPGRLRARTQGRSPSGAEQQLLGSITQLVAATQAEAELHPGQRATHRKAPGLSHLIRLRQERVGRPQPQVGITGRQTPHRQRHDPRQAHRPVVLLTALQWPGRIDQDGGKTTRRQARDLANTPSRHATAPRCRSPSARLSCVFCLLHDVPPFLFLTCYLLRASSLPAFRVSAVGRPYPIHSTNTRVLQGLPIYITKRCDTRRSRAISVVPPQETKWTYAPLSGHESRCCSFRNKWEKMRAHL